MLLSERKVVRAFAAAVLLTAVAGCQVRPLYSPASPGAAGVSTNAALSSIAITEAKDRVAQEVRNKLIFALSGGAGEPASPSYTLDLGVTQQVNSVANVEVDTKSSGQPTAGSVSLTSLYVLKDASGQEVASGKRTASASFDRPLQQFAALRAQRDAEDRAAADLAELLRLALAADLAK